MTRIDQPADNKLLVDFPIPEGWVWTRVADLGQSGEDVVKTGPFGAILKSKEFVSTGIPILAVGNVQSGRLDLEDARVDHVTEKKASELSAYRTRAGDVLFTRSGTIGRSAVVPHSAEGWLMSYHLLRVRAEPRLINPQYLYFVFSGCEASQQYTNESVIGTTRPGINTNILRGVPIPLPPRAEQERIVAKVEELRTRINSARNQLGRVTVILQRLRQAVLAAACSGRLTEDWRLASEKPELAQTETSPVENDQRHSLVGTSDFVGQSALSELPARWVWATLGELAASEKNSITDGPFGSNLKTEHYTATGPRVIRLQNIGNYRFTDVAAHISLEHFESLAKHQIRGGDVAIACLGDPIPRACIIPKSVGPAIVKADCIRLKPNAAQLDSRYVCYVLNDAQTRSRMSEIVHGVGRARLNLKQIKSIPIPLPPLAEQVEIALRVESLLSIMDQVGERVAFATQHNNKLTESILAKAFRGDLVPTEAQTARSEDREYEPASVLLERLKNQRESDTLSKSNGKPKRPKMKLATAKG
jgi:type I restriction enzyme S subunit